MLHFAKSFLFVLVDFFYWLSPSSPDDILVIWHFKVDFVFSFNWSLFENCSCYFGDSIIVIKSFEFYPIHFTSLFILFWSPFGVNKLSFYFVFIVENVKASFCLYLINFLAILPCSINLKCSVQQASSQLISLFSIFPQFNKSCRFSELQ